MPAFFKDGSCFSAPVVHFKAEAMKSFSAKILSVAFRLLPPPAAAFAAAAVCRFITAVAVAAAAAAAAVAASV